MSHFRSNWRPGQEDLRPVGAPATLIRIVSTPPGEAPEHIRKAWIGLVLPLAEGYAGRREARTFGVLSAPRTMLLRLLAPFLGAAKQGVGYIVAADIAIILLASHAPEAAAWWRLHVPRTGLPGQKLIFDASACQEVRG